MARPQCASVRPGILPLYLPTESGSWPNARAHRHNSLSLADLSSADVLSLLGAVALPSTRLWSRLLIGDREQEAQLRSVDHFDVQRADALGLRHLRAEIYGQSLLVYIQSGFQFRLAEANQADLIQARARQLHCGCSQWNRAC